ncbi:MAG: inovirus Gp2 family protein [Colwellia sp.]|nr:inovirus Gp2 family protein [Colwellia sp.]
MNARLKTNPNLTIHTDRYFNGMKVQVSHGPLVREYLAKIDQVMQYAVMDCNRILAIRIDLRFPEAINCLDVPLAYDNTAISRFIESLKAQLIADLNNKSKMGIRVFTSNFRYIWVREKDTAMNDHHHLVLFFNKDAYNHLGDITADKGNTAARIKKAWASAIGLELWEVEGLVNFTNNGLFRLDSNSPSYQEDYHDLFFAISYLAKLRSKNFGDGTKSLGCSRQ